MLRLPVRAIRIHIARDPSALFSRRSSSWHRAKPERRRRPATPDRPQTARRHTQRMMVARRLNLSEQMGQPPVAFVEGAAASGHAVEPSGMHDISPVIAVGVFFSTAATDAVYVFFSAAVTARRRVLAASWSSLWYLLSAFVVISIRKIRPTCSWPPRAPGSERICRYPIWDATESRR
jgi:hypothetical protein